MIANFVPDHITLTYQVVEDNGGGLHLFVFSDHPIYSHSGYEYIPGSLTTDLDAIDSGDTTTSWEDCDDDPQAIYDEITSYDFGWDIVCDNISGKRTLYPDVMGVAARIEFGVD